MSVRSRGGVLPEVERVHGTRLRDVDQPRVSPPQDAVTPQTGHPERHEDESCRETGQHEEAGAVRNQAPPPLVHHCGSHGEEGEDEEDEVFSRRLESQVNLHGGQRDSAGLNQTCTGTEPSFCTQLAPVSTAANRLASADPEVDARYRTRRGASPRPPGSVPFLSWPLRSSSAFHACPAAAFDFLMGGGCLLWRTGHSGRQLRRKRRSWLPAGLRWSLWPATCTRQPARVES